MQDQALEERDQQSRHRLGIERSWNFAPCLCALYHAREYRLWDFHAVTNRNREPEHLRCVHWPTIYGPFAVLGPGSMGGTYENFYRKYEGLQAQNRGVDDANRVDGVQI